MKTKIGYKKALNKIVTYRISLVGLLKQKEYCVTSQIWHLKNKILVKIYLKNSNFVR